MRSSSSPTTCSRRRGCRSAPPSSTSAISSNMARRRKSSPIRGSRGPRITLPAATAEESAMVSTGHTIKAFDDDLDQLRATIAQMGGLAETAIAASLRALTGRDAVLAQVVIDDDAKID